MARTEVFQRFIDINPAGVESCNLLDKDFRNKWGELDEITKNRVEKGLMVAKKEEYELVPVKSVATEILESTEDRIFTLEVALRAIATGETRDSRFKGKKVEEIALEALRISHNLIIED